MFCMQMWSLLVKIRVKMNDEQFFGKTPRSWRDAKIEL